MSRKAKLLIIVLSFLFLGWFIFQPLNDIGIDKPYAQAPVSGQEITASELNEFLNLWSRILQGPLKKHIRQISLSSGSKYPQAISNWLEAQQWNVERFFYDEERIHGLVNCVSLKDNLDSNIELSKRGQSNLRQIIEEQRQHFELCEYSEAEMALIKANLYQITEIFAGRAIMDKQ